MNVMLLAAGEGTRLRPHTLIRPKPAMPFLNIPLASYPLALLEGLKIDRLVVNTFHLPTKVVDLFLHLNHGARKVHFSHEVSQLLGSGGGLGAARDYFKTSEDLILMNADEVILPLEKSVVAQALEQHQKRNSFCTLLTMDHPGVGTQFGGVWLDQDNKVRGFGKTAPDGLGGGGGSAGGKAEHFIGLQILSGKVFDYIPKGRPSNILYDAVTNAIHAGHRVDRYKINCHWYETGNSQDFLKATEASLELLAGPAAPTTPTVPADNYAQTYLKKVLERFGTETPLVESHGKGLLFKTPSSQFGKNVSMSGFVVLGPHCQIGSDCQLHNVVIADKVQIAPGTQVQNQIVLENI